VRTNIAPKPHDLGGLTSLRGIGALMIVLFHFGAFGGDVPLIERSAFFDKGYLWVDMFFMLSGFVIAHVYGATFDGQVDSASYWRFMWIRFARIYPLYAFTLLGFVALALVRHALRGKDVFDQEHTIAALFVTAALIQAWGVFDIYGWNPPAWSISAEVVAYFVFPFLAVVAVRSRLAWSAVLVLAIVVLGILGAGPHGLQVPAGLNVALCLSQFIIGMALYRARDAVARSAVPVDVLLVLTALLLVLALHFGAADLIVVALFAPLIYLMPAARGFARRLSNARPLVFLGDISYSVYLMHDLVLVACTRLVGDLQSPLHQTLGVLTVIAAATLTWRYVEWPARDWLRARWPGKPATVAAMAMPR
jgi:peptidoglycan/LPS O-acetylase OafA/YrhL